MSKLNKYSDKINNYFYTYNSKEYQRVLSGIRIFFSLMKQRSFMNTLFLTILMFFFIFFLFIFKEIQKGTESLISIIFNSISTTSFFIVFLLLMFLFFLYWQYDFKLYQGVKVFIRTPINFFIIIFMLIITPMSFFQSQNSFLEIVSSVLTVLIMLFTLLLFVSFSFLKPQSLLKYASEKMLKTNEKTSGLRLIKSGYYTQYYYSIFTYYKSITDRFRLSYRDDIAIRTHSQNITLLCSYGVISNKEKKEIVTSSPA